LRITFRCPPELEGLLPKPVAAKTGLPDWFKAMPMHAFDGDLGMDVMTVKKCPPFVDAMTYGFLMPLPCDVRVSNGRFDWDWDLPPTHTGRHTRAPMTFHLNTQAIGSPLFEDDKTIVKFNSFWTIELDAGWSLFCTHPVNRPDLPFQSLTGLVDSDLYTDNFVNFVAKWLDPTFDGVLEKGTPVAQYVPVLREEFDYAFETLEHDAADRFKVLRTGVGSGPGVYRRTRRATK